LDFQNHSQNSTTTSSSVIFLEDVEIKQKLGGGNFGEVYKGIYQGGDVALKKLRAEDEGSFVNEALLLGKLQHPNVVQYIGIYVSQTGEKYIVMEYLPLGSLNNVLVKEKNNLQIVDLVGMAKQAAAGMLHLESSHIIHRDLALRNLLVGKSTVGGYLVKISDFGLSRAVETAYYKSDDGKIPIKWSAPEVLQYGTHTSKSDVYSFGVLLWELFSYGKLPFEEMNNDRARIAILNGDTLLCPPGCPPKFYEIMKRCWNKESQRRPTFKQLVEEIDGLWESMKASHGLSKGQSATDIHKISRPAPPIPNQSQGFYGGFSVYN